MDRYETADHDYMHAKDYFNNYKFGYIERTTKMLLLQSLKVEDREAQDLLTILSSSKAQLKSVKSVGSDASKLIAELSEATHEMELRLRECEKALHEEQQREMDLAEEYSRIEALDENLKSYDELVIQFDKKCQDIQQHVDKIDLLKKKLALLETTDAEEDLRGMRAKKENLSARQRRLSLIAMENYMEESYAWYSRAVEFVKNMFGIQIVTVEQENNEMYMRFKALASDVGIFVKDGAVVDCKLYNANNEILENMFKSISKVAVLINEPRMLFMLAYGIYNGQGRGNAVEDV
ncbi:hypothetical protein HK407_03g05940 [Ordospora pajunii]|jgi:chromosome segregation ATPase|uniref:uncharacterized protein n=1 Tax=Ordospora pajunii TaxID=3039483 RepID=UPI0029527A0E|nr:uncharacterized protein HK407_03g05940 [Ordospora pajunii]KAH9411842.1 hypothetical protein HK407_03g05940 [Ordospora pajunii]